MIGAVDAGGDAGALRSTDGAASATCVGTGRDSLCASAWVCAAPAFAALDVGNTACVFDAARLADGTANARCVTALFDSVLEEYNAGKGGEFALPFLTLMPPTLLASVAFFDAIGPNDVGGDATCGGVVGTAIASASFGVGAVFVATGLRTGVPTSAAPASPPAPVVGSA